jgi:sigma-B regulation protein RsbU (phosphoserine phosphatase)
MVTAIEPILQTRLINQRHRLEAAAGFPRPDEITRLLEEVDAALRRMDDGIYGICEVCHEPIEAEVLLSDPVSRFCLGDLTPKEQQALENDLQLAAQIQRGLLPQSKQTIHGWQVAYHYQPAGVVSGDYCDFIDGDNESLHFVLGDVSGKGVAASMLMAHLHAMFRTLVSIKLPLDKMVEQASRVFCESTLPTQYATLVCGHADGNGTVEICNAGHLPPLHRHRSGVRQVDATGLPVGIFGTETFQVTKVEMEKGDLLFLYTDGLSETTDAHGNEYGAERLAKLIDEHRDLAPADLIDLCRMDQHAFGKKRQADDLTLMAVQRSY